ncbi:FAD-binding oxidoreductase [Streptomyces sp. NPDC051740]|uniref:FAD-binding oxidoreductase n=1 Tax=Streptomyces sp. NPDC051740 TaxID=3365673 RepID=UPI0037BA872B
MTAVPTPEPTPAAPDGYPLTMTTLDGEVIGATAAEGQSVLDAAADAGYLLPALCRKGTCGACVATVVDGEFTLGDHSELALSPERAASGGALLCRTYAGSPLTISLPYERSRVLTGTISVCSATVAAIDRCTHDVVRLLLRLDDDPEHGGTAEFEPGQFAQLQIPGEDETRAYSYSNAPNWDGELEFYVRLREGGHFSTWLDHTARTGDTLTVHGPQGAFGLVETGPRPRWFVAGGTGVSPLFSMARRMAEFQEPHALRFYLGVGGEDDIFGEDVLAEVGGELADFSVQLCVNRPCERTDVRAGGPVTALAEDLADLRKRDEELPDLYVCGPPGMIDAVEKVAQEAGVPITRILSEKFSVSTTA